MTYLSSAVLEPAIAHAGRLLANDVLPLPVANKAAAVMAAATFVACYLVLVRHLRYNRRDNLIRELGFSGLTRAEIYRKITLNDSHKIMTEMNEYEFHWAYLTGLQFALFRTYAIPSISIILSATKQLCEPKHAGKRYADTRVLITELLSWPLDTERSSKGLARINYIHSRYPIKQDDMLYTLLLFAVQPVIFVRRFEWRELTELELASQWKMWYEIGIRMKIPAEKIPGTFEAMEEWMLAYEKEFMVPSDSNAYVGGMTVNLLLHWAPGRVGRHLGHQLVFGVVDDRLRRSMMFPKPERWAKPLIRIFMGFRRLLIKHAMLPRTKPIRDVRDKADEQTGRYFFVNYDNEPWYIPPTLSNRWGLWAIIARLTGRPYAGKPGYGENGYMIESMGPVQFEKHGIEEVRKDAEEIRKTSEHACPFGF